MKLRISAAVIATGLLATGAYAQSVFNAKLVGVKETPIVITGGSGSAHVTISEDEQSIDYELTYSGLEGSVVPATPPAKVLFAHIHVGRPTIAGGVAVFFCGGGNTAATKANCPASGTVTGTWTQADIVGPASQGVDPTNPNNEDSFARLVKAIKAGLTYANVHTTRSPGGEIRGQLVRAHHDGDDDDGDAK